MYCSRCGRQFNVRDGRCPFCGTYASPRQNQQYYPYNRDYPNYPQPYNPYGILHRYDLFSILALCFASAYTLLWLIALIVIWYSSSRTGFFLWFLLPTLLLGIPAITFSIIGLFQVRKNGKRGKEFDLMGLVGAGVSFLSFLILILRMLT